MSNSPNVIIQEASITVSRIDDRYMLKHYFAGRLTQATAWKIKDELLPYEKEIIRVTLGFPGDDD